MKKKLGEIFLFSKDFDFSKIEDGYGSRYSDGSGYFEDEYGTTEYYNSNHAHDASTNSEDFGLIEGLGSLLLVFILGKLSKKISKKEDNENYEEEKEYENEEEDEDEQEEKDDEEQKEVKTQKTRKKYRTKKKKNNDIKILLICFSLMKISLQVG